jgi:hypothetical protein
MTRESENSGNTKYIVVFAEVVKLPAAVVHTVLALLLALIAAMLSLLAIDPLALESSST